MIAGELDLNRSDESDGQRQRPDVSGTRPTVPSARVPNEPQGGAAEPDGPASADGVRFLRSIAMTAAEDADEKRLQSGD